MQWLMRMLFRKRTPEIVDAERKARKRQYEEMRKAIRERREVRMLDEEARLLRGEGEGGRRR
jgi:hypothetical protein